MKKIKYKIKEIVKNVFAIIVPDDYDRAMLFLRPQEYSESPNPKFRNQKFDMWDYVKWYDVTYNKGRGFTYADDWDGFNFPLKTAVECYNKLPFKLTTKYDIIFIKILKTILGRVSRKNIDKVYIISFDKMGSATMHHELAHAQYFIDKDYRKRATELISSLPKKTHMRLIKNLHKMGYYKDVMQSEIQAYLRGRDWSEGDFNKNINKTVLKHWHNKFRITLAKFKIDFLS